MKENYKIDKELLFKNNIKDITSISLDSDSKINNNEIVGNFIISGEYKIHEVSINKEKFEFKIPFKHEIKSDIDTKTIKLEISNFIYDYKKDELIVNIDYDITGARKDVLLFDDEETLDDFLKSREVEVINDRIDEIKSDIDRKEKKTEEEKSEEKEIKDIKIDIKNEDNEMKDINIINEDNEKEYNKEEISKSLLINEDKDINIIKDNEFDNINNVDVFIENNRDDINTEKVVNSVNTVDDKYITYKVITYNESDTIEGIIIKYHISLEELKEYNDLTNIKYNDKIIIPCNE